MRSRGMWTVVSVIADQVTARTNAEPLYPPRCATSNPCCANLAICIGYGAQRRFLALHKQFDPQNRAFFRWRSAALMHNAIAAAHQWRAALLLPSRKRFAN